MLPKKNTKEMIISCLIGDPVLQSVSPHMYNYFGQRAGFDYYSHVKLRIPSDDRENLPRALESVKRLGFAGINITIPYKIEALKYLDKIDQRAKTIGAVNAIVNKDGRLIGYNTDGLGALSAIENQLRKIKASDRIVVLGSGGAARAIVGTLLPLTKNITVLNRQEDFNLAQSLKKAMKQITVLLLNEANILQSVSKADFVINATPVGMYPTAKESIISEQQFTEINKKTPIYKKYFFDTVYNPYITKFLNIARSYKAKIAPGLFMMVYQGANSFQLWTGKKIDKKDIEAAIKILKQKMGIKDR